MNQLVTTSRRLFMSRSSQIGLSAAAVGLLAGCSGMAVAQTSNAMGADVGILNVALGLEHEAINAYQLGAGSGLLQSRCSTWRSCSSPTTRAIVTRSSRRSRRWAVHQ